MPLKISILSQGEEADLGIVASFTGARVVERWSQSGAEAWREELWKVAELSAFFGAVALSCERT